MGTTELIAASGGGGGGALRPGREQILHYLGCLGTYHDDQGRSIWSPALPGADAPTRHEWYRILREHGATHIPIGPFDPGPSYPGIVHWDNPDWTQDPQAIRQLCDEMLSTPSASGYGFIPVIFIDGGGRNPIPRLEVILPTLTTALAGIEDALMWVPAWEPVKGDWLSAEVSWALEHMHAAMPEIVLGYHGSPGRLVGSSNPLEPGDPWKGDEASFYTSHGGQWIDYPMYQTPHAEWLFKPCVCPNKHEKFGHIGDKEAEQMGDIHLECWMNRFEDYVSRFTGYHGWKELPCCLYEVGAQQTTRGEETPEASIEQSRLGRDLVAAKWGMKLGFGDGIP